MPSPEQQIKEQVAKSIELTQKMLDAQEGLETKIKALEASGGGAAELKEQVTKMADDNAKAIDEINALTKSLQDRQDEHETQIAAKLKGGLGGATGIDLGEPVIKAYNEHVGDGERMGFAEKVRADVDAHQMVFRKTVTSLAASAGDAQIPDYEPTLIAPGQQAITLLDVLPRSGTTSALIYWVREVLSSRVNNVDIQSLDFTGTGQGTALGESDFVFNQESAETRTFGHTAKIALQLLEDVSQLRGYLENQMRYMVRFDLEDQILNGDGTGKNISGIKDNATAYDVTQDAGTANLQKLDVLRHAINQAALTFFPATAAILHPSDTVSLELLKDSQQNYIWANPTSGNGIRPWGVPVVSTTQQTLDEFTVGAMNHVEVVTRKEIEVMVATENEDDFDKLLATMRAYGRFGLKIYQPGSLIDGDFSVALTGS